MKKLVLLAMLLPLAWGGLQAQTQDSLFSDPGFDYWESGEGQDGVTYDDLMDPFWGSLNELATLPPDMFTGPVTLFKDAGRSGEAEDFAPRMESSSMVFGGEGLFNTVITGPGRVWLQTMPLSGVAAEILKFMPSTK